MVWFQPVNVNGLAANIPTGTEPLFSSLGNARHDALEEDDRVLSKRQLGETLLVDKYREENPEFVIKDWTGLVVEAIGEFRKAKEKR